MNNAPEHGPRRRMFGYITTTRQPSGSGPGVAGQKKSIYMGKSDSAANHRASVEKKTQGTFKAVVPARSVRIAKRKLASWCW